MKKTALSSLFVVGLLAALTIALWPRTPAPDAETSAAAAPAEQRWDLGLRVVPGLVEHYAFSYTQANQTTALQPQAGQGGVETQAVTLSGDVALQGSFSLAGRPDGTEALLRIESLDQHRFVIEDKELLPDHETVQAQLLGEAALVSFTPRGEVATVSFGEQAHPMFERMVQLLLSETQISLEPASTAWSRDERSLHGQAPTDYLLSSQDAQRAEVEKRRSSYRSLQALPLQQGKVEQQVSYLARAAISRQGRLLSFVGDETIAAADGARTLLSIRSHIEVRHTRSAPGGQETAAAFERRRALGEIGFSEEAEAQSLRQRVAGLTGQQMLADLDRFGFGAEMPDHSAWLWRATGLLRLEPDLVDDLVQVFQSKKLGHEGRGLVLDLMVGAGHYRAQEALLTALRTPAAKADDGYSMLFQRINLLQHPSPDTVAFLQKTQAESEGLQRDLATNALGSAAGNLFRNGKVERGAAIGDALLEQLGEQGDYEAQKLYLVALGNAGLPHHADVLRSYAGSPSSLVRYQCASALRKLGDDGSRQTLVGLLTDVAERVQIRALASLHARQDLTPADIERIYGLVQRRLIKEGAYASVITLVSPHLGSDPNVRRIFETMLGQQLQDKDIKARLRAILAY